MRYCPWIVGKVVDAALSCCVCCWTSNISMILCVCKTKNYRIAVFLNLCETAAR